MEPWTWAEILFVAVAVGIGLLVRWLRGGTDGEMSRRLERQNKADFARDKLDREEAKRVAHEWLEKNPGVLGSGESDDAR